MRGDQSSSGCAGKKLLQYMAKMFKTFRNDQQGQIIIIITVVVEGATGQHHRSKCQLAFHSRSFRVRDSRCVRERESKTAGPGQGITSGEQVRVP